MTRRFTLDADPADADAAPAPSVDRRTAARWSSRMTVFAVAWALATLLHVWTERDSHLVLLQPSPEAVPFTAWLHLLLGVMAVVVLLRPWDARPLIALCVPQIASVVTDMPALSNHWLLAGLVALALLLAAASVLAGRRRPVLEEVERRFVPAAVLTLVVAYGFAAFSKLNTGFLDPAGSCGRLLAGETLGSYGLGGLARRPEVGWLGIATALLAEGSVAVLLAFRVTRPYGVLLGVTFHGLVALNLLRPYSNFSAVLYALFLLALPAGFAPWLGARVRARLRAPGRLAPVLAAVAAFLCLVLWLWPSRFPQPPLFVGSQVLWTLYAVLAVTAVVGYLRATSWRPERPAAMPRPSRGPALLLVVPLLAGLNGLTPYLELKTDFSWIMYSNLVTGGGESNHLLVRRTLPLSAERGRTVRIIWSDDPVLRPYVRSDSRVTLLGLRSYAADHPRSELVYEVDGARRTALPVAADPLLNRPPPLWQEKLQAYLAVSGGAARPSCITKDGALR